MYRLEIKGDPQTAYFTEQARVILDFALATQDIGASEGQDIMDEAVSIVSDECAIQALLEGGLAHAKDVRESLKSNLDSGLYEIFSENYDASINTAVGDLVIQGNIK